MAIPRGIIMVADDQSNLSLYLESAALRFSFGPSR